MILIDNGHGENTPGKRSPDGRLREYLYTREIAEEVVADLRRRGYEAERIVRENIDVALATRVRRVNDVCKELGSANVLLVSIHVDAAGDGSGWMQAGGWSAYTTPGRTKSDRLAECLLQGGALLWACMWRGLSIISLLYESETKTKYRCSCSIPAYCSGSGDGIFAGGV
ncbi:N-acetylmuramoyl-L-alanine amidase [Porphyromonas gingivalis]|uniref:N-acetylmuramoyl-L-alanine amidase n=1 Tax=Porphyromonas gingivalis TaxID=837 RepID=UPI001F3229CF|nr:N-acetylmuramoyl-L-alanine amidase [Porphyromonas gingivalis]MCE8191115.1 N-acetylmuramoyl-L-alanine amidase [Porphyromonas gingivalis]